MIDTVPFNIRGSHGVAWTTELPSWLPTPVTETMLTIFSQHLCLELASSCGLGLGGAAEADTNMIEQGPAQNYQPGHRSTPSASSVASVASAAMSDGTASSIATGDDDIPVNIEIENIKHLVVKNRRYLEFGFGVMPLGS